MKRILCFAVPIMFLAGIFAAPGGEFWEKKEYRQWSQKECSKLLEDSPWAKDFTLTMATIMPSNKASDDSQNLYVKYQMQFRSALPVRQAIVRQMQIAQKYDSLSPDQRQQFDKNAEAFLSADFADMVVVYVTYSTNSRTNDLEIARWWQTQTTDLLKNYVFLSNSKGDKVALSRFIASQGAERSFQFIFPRQINGAPIIGLKDKSLKLEFTYPVIAGLGDEKGFMEDKDKTGKLAAGTGFMEFKPEKMIFQGNFAY